MLYSPGTEVVSTPAPTEQAAPETKIETPAPPPEPVKSLAQVIREEREARESASRRETETATLKTRAETAEAKLAGWERAKDNAILDSVGHLETLGFDKAQMVDFAENIMFTL